MDPNAAYRIVCDDTRDVVERAEAATYLLVWLAMDGFTPDGVARRKAIEDCQLAVFRALDALEDADALSTVERIYDVH